VASSKGNTLIVSGYDHGSEFDGDRSLFVCFLFHQEHINNKNMKKELRGDEAH
jgi:hypothetical protein